MNTETQRPTPETDALSFSVGKNALHPTTVVVALNDARKIERERDEAREQIQMMLKHDATRLESDSIVGSCDCQTKTPKAKHHKPGCKYRLICERDEARQDFLLASGELRVPMPQPGSDMARVMVANALMRKQRDEAREQIDALQAELTDIRQRLKGHADSRLDGENGLAAATMRGFDQLQVENEAMREAIKEAWIEIQYAEAGFAGLALRVCPNDSAVESVLNRMTEALAKLQPLLKP